MKYLILVAFLLTTGCGEFSDSTDNNPLANVGRDGDPGKTDEDNQAPPHEETPEPEDPAPTDAICYLTAPGDIPCFNLVPRSVAHEQEPKYKYIDPFTYSRFPNGLDKWQYRPPQNLNFFPDHRGNTPISENFTRAEVLKSGTKRGHYGYISPVMVEKMQALRDHFGKPLIVNSSYRSPGYNATISGAAKFSRHQHGDAIDFKIPGISFEAIAKKCTDFGAAFYQIYRTHIHCDWRTTELNELIFGEDNRPPIGSREKIDVIDAIIENTIIKHQVLLGESHGHKRAVSLQAETIQEDGGELIYDWVVEKNGQTLFASKQKNPKVRLAPGKYQVLLNIGGSTAKVSSLVIE